MPVSGSIPVRFRSASVGSSWRGWYSPPSRQAGFMWRSAWASSACSLSRSPISDAQTVTQPVSQVSATTCCPMTTDGGAGRTESVRSAAGTTRSTIRRG